MVHGSDDGPPAARSGCVSRWPWRLAGAGGRAGIGRAARLRRRPSARPGRASPRRHRPAGAWRSGRGRGLLARPRRVIDDRGAIRRGCGLGRSCLALLAAQRAGQVDAAVLEQERLEVARVEELDAHVRVELAQPAQLAVLLAHQALLERRQLDIEVELRQVEVGREALHDGPVEVEEDGEGARLVAPLDLVVVEDPRQLGLAGVGEDGRRGRSASVAVTLARIRRSRRRHRSGAGSHRRRWPGSCPSRARRRSRRGPSWPRRGPRARCAACQSPTDTVAMAEAWQPQARQMRSTKETAPRSARMRTWPSP